jgi:hypothetical protein
MICRLDFDGGGAGRCAAVDGRGAGKRTVFANIDQLCQQAQVLPTKADIANINWICQQKPVLPSSA